MLTVKAIHQRNRSDNGEPVVIVVYEGEVVNEFTGDVNDLATGTPPKPGTFQGNVDDFIGQQMQGAHIERYLLSDEELAKLKEKGQDTYNGYPVTHGLRVRVDNPVTWANSTRNLRQQIQVTESITAGKN